MNGVRRGAVAAMLLGGWSACQERAPDEHPAAVDAAAEDTPGTRHIVLFTLDTLRADHLSCYGYGRPTSPRLDELSREATLYRHASSTAPWTLPSHASLFTGLHPFEHGAHTYDRDPDVRPADMLNNVRPLALEHTTVAEVLREHGYRTGAVVSNQAYLNDKYQLDQGFDEYDVQKGTIESVVERVGAWLERHRDEAFFLFINTMDTHRPYNTAPRPGLFDHDVPQRSSENVMTLYDIVMGRGEEPPADLVQELHDQYDLGIYNLDAGVGAILDRLKELGLYDDALIVVTSDHGEYFGEHGLVEHSKDVYEEALHVPLLIKEPHQTDARVEERRISLVHLAGRILRAARGVPAAAAAALSPYEWPTPVVLAENYYARMKDMRSPWGARLNRVRTAVYQGPFKYIRSSDGQHELFHLDSDPREQVNLLEREPALARSLAERLEGMLADRRSAVEPGAVEVLLSAEDLKALEALGYN